MGRVFFYRDLQGPELMFTGERLMSCDRVLQHLCLQADSKELIVNWPGTPLADKCTSFSEGQQKGWATLSRDDPHWKHPANKIMSTSANMGDSQQPITGWDVILVTLADAIRFIFAASDLMKTLTTLDKRSSRRVMMQYVTHAGCAECTRPVIMSRRTHALTCLARRWKDRTLWLAHTMPCHLAFSLVEWTFN